MRNLFIYAATSGRGGVVNVFGVSTLGGVAIVSGTIFEIVVSLCCITLGGFALRIFTLLVIGGVTCAVG